MENRGQPASYADIRLFTGDQRQGKSTVAVGFGVGDYYTHLTGIKSPNGQIIKAKSVAKSVNKEDYLLLKRMKLYPDKFKYVRVFSDDGKQSKLIRMPKDYLVLSSVHIFANFHLYGVEYAPINLLTIIENINTTLFNNAWILSDESGMTSARRSMEAMGKLIAEFSATIGKRKAHFCVMAQYNRMVEVLIRLFATTRILCSYDKRSQLITCDIDQRGEPKFTVDVWAPRYWPFFDSEEIIETPQYKIDSALAKVYPNRMLVGANAKA